MSYDALLYVAGQYIETSTRQGCNIHLSIFFFFFYEWPDDKVKCYCEVRF